MNEKRPPLNFASQTIWTGDNLDIMRGMNSDSVDLIYLDPPFNSKANYAAPVGSKAAGAAFKDAWGLDDVKLVWHGEIKHEYPSLYALLTVTRGIHGDSMMSYLIYMAIRVMEMRRLLKPDGSIYLHCDPTASHYLKLLMDAVFGKENYRNEIVWAYTGPGSPRIRQFNRKHDVIHWYSNSKTTWTFNREEMRVPYKDPNQRPRKAFDTGGAFKPENVEKMRRRGKVLEDWWPGIALAVRSSKERTGYPTQKPLALLRRIIQASSNEGGMVLDPFCGCATTCIAAEQLGRRWVGIDISEKAADLVKLRRQEVAPMFQSAHRTDIPKRTDLGKIPRYNCAENRLSLYGEQGGYCNGCAAHFEPRDLRVNHIVAKAEGGNDHISNLQLLCASCKAAKGQKSREELIMLLTDKGWIKRRQEIIANENRRFKQAPPNR